MLENPALYLSEKIIVYRAKLGPKTKCNLFYPFSVEYLPSPAYTPGWDIL